NGSGAYSATWLERQSYLPCGTPLLSSSAGCGDCSNKEQRTLCNGGTCMTKANSWRGHNTNPTPRPPQTLATPLSRKKNQSRRRTFCVEVERKKMPDPEEDPPDPADQKSPFKPVDSDQFQIGPLTSKIRFSVTELYLRRFSAERALSLRPAILSSANRRSHLLTRASRVPIFKAISLPLSPSEAKRIILARSTIRCSVLELRIQRKRISFSLVETRISGAGRPISPASTIITLSIASKH